MCPRPKPQGVTEYDGWTDVHRKSVKVKVNTLMYWQWALATGLSSLPAYCNKCRNLPFVCGGFCDCVATRPAVLWFATSMTPWAGRLNSSDLASGSCTSLTTSPADDGSSAELLSWTSWIFWSVDDRRGMCKHGTGCTVRAFSIGCSTTKWFGVNWKRSCGSCADVHMMFTGGRLGGTFRPTTRAVKGLRCSCARGQVDIIGLRTAALTA